jgi:hypothetical protein
MNKKNSPIEYHYAPHFLSNSMRVGLGVYKGRVKRRRKGKPKKE